MASVRQLVSISAEAYGCGRCKAVVRRWLGLSGGGVPSCRDKEEGEGEEMSKIDFRNELERLINRQSMESGSNTPDFILAEYLATCLSAFDRAVCQRTNWYCDVPGEKAGQK